MPPSCRKPLGRSISIGCFTFVALLCFVLSIVNFATYKGSLYNRYKDHIRDIINFTKTQIDTDDLAECIRTGQKSPKYFELQEFMDSFKDSANIHYLYIIRPLNTNPVDNVMDIIAAMSSYEKQYMPEMEVKLNGLTGEGYSVESVTKYLNAAKRSNITYFTAEWAKGVTYKDYTGAIPLYTSKGEYVGLLCVDIDVMEIEDVIKKATLINIILILLLGVLFTILFIVWSNYYITKPILKLENTVTDFAYNHQGKENVESIVMKKPDIHTENEVESLANAVIKMSEDMRTYVENVIEAEGKSRMLSELASKDALTQVRNKTSYDHFVEEIDVRIKKGKAEFAVAMMDLNNLNKINDTYGHERGNDYIKMSCDAICRIFCHSPVFRIGGDEFVAILQGTDYKNRQTLFEQAEKVFNGSNAFKDAEPWQVLSVAIGMSEFSIETDKCLNDVFNRADEIMYDNKLGMKAALETGDKADKK